MEVEVRRHENTETFPEKDPSTEVGVHLVKSIDPLTIGPSPPTHPN